MRPALCLSAAALAAVCATWAYRVNYATQEALNRLADLRAEIAMERETLAVLNAEWAYLNRPDRLAALVAGPGAGLGLAPLTPEQFAEAAIVAYPPDPDLPDPDLSDPELPDPELPDQNLIAPVGGAGPEDPAAPPLETAGDAE